MQSARRAGFSPCWLDLFGDADTRAAAPGQALPAGGWPARPEPWLARLPTGLPTGLPIIVGGALENHPAWLDALGRHGRLLGTVADVCRGVTDPLALTQCWSAAGLPAPRVITAGAAPGAGRWLSKPLASAGGLRIRPAEPPIITPQCYLQERLEGDTMAGAFLADASGCELLGVTASLTGDGRFGASGYLYTGSLGPITLSADSRRHWQRLGVAAWRRFRLRGLFGIDAVVADGLPQPVELNPRYTAAMEVLEAAFGATVIDRHVAACVGEPWKPWPSRADGCAGKAVVYARQAVCFSDCLLEGLTEPGALRAADIPAEGSHIEAGHPLLTLLAGGADAGQVEARLVAAAAALQTRLEALA